MSERSFRFKAVNTAESSENKIHSNEEARRYGFKGGLVPGAGTFTYACEGVRQFAGQDWVGTGFTDIRFTKPIYDGETITVAVEGEPSAGSFIVLNEEGDECSSGRFSEGLSGEYEGKKPQLRPVEPWAEPKPMVGATLVDVDQMPSVDEALTTDAVSDYYDGLGLDFEPYRELGLVPAAYLSHLYVALRRANFVAVGPSIHASSQTQMLRPVKLDEQINLRSRVESLFTRRGQKFWTYEIGYYDQGDKPVAWDLHRGIYEVAVKEA